MFVYTREAHPGERVPRHDSFDAKLGHARLLRDELGIRRPILVDDLAGTAHRGFGGLPNMSWVIERDGTVAYKASWTRAANIDAFLRRYLDAKGHRPAGRQIGPYHTEQLELRQLDRAGFMAGLERNGPAAVEQWRRAEQLMGPSRPGGGPTVSAG